MAKTMRRLPHFPVMPRGGMDTLIVFSTFADADRAREVGRTLAAERLAACVNVLPDVTSLYIWQGRPAEETEALALIKTRREVYPALEARRREVLRKCSRDWTRISKNDE